MENKYSKYEQSYIDIFQSFRRKVREDHNYLKENDAETINKQHYDTESTGSSSSSDSNCINCVITSNSNVLSNHELNENIDIDVAQNVDIMQNGDLNSDIQTESDAMKIVEVDNGTQTESDAVKIIQVDSGLGIETFIRKVGDTISYKLLPGFRADSELLFSIPECQFYKKMVYRGLVLDIRVMKVLVWLDCI